ncbi:MAG: TIGR00269 family protein [Nitrososphaerota archaeon]|nr:TIGR00269 family protein [Candidatus Geocrenenecus dongiae]
MGMAVKCTFCGTSEVVYVRRYSGETLCRRCFLENMVERVKATISKYELLNPFDRIAVAVSGGKDSLSLLKILVRIERDFPRASLVAITVDEGIPLYRDEAVENAVRFISELGVEHRVVSFKELYGFTLTEVVESNVSRSLNLQPCTICGILRRRALTVAAKECGASVIATAHTLDDIVQTYLMNILRGDTRLTPIGVRREVPGVIPRIAPFRLIPEREIVLYAYFSKIPFQTYTCPYTELSMRDKIRSFLTEYEELFPGTLYTALSSFEKMFARSSQEDGSFCAICGEPTSRKICRACEIIELVSSRIKK